LSLIGGLSLWRFYFRAYAGSIKSPQVVEFLGALLRHLPGPLLVVWDGAPIHRSALVRDFVATQATRLDHQATRALRRMRRRPSLIRACWKQADLWP
jgi:hypothetical protein